MHLGELFFKMIRGEASDEEIEELGGGFGAAGYRPYAGTDEVRGAGMADVEGNFEVRGCAARDCSVLFSVFLWKIRKNSHFAPCFRQIIRAECATMASSKDHGSWRRDSVAHSGKANMTSMGTWRKRGTYVNL